MGIFAKWYWTLRYKKLFTIPAVALFEERHKHANVADLDNVSTPAGIKINIPDASKRISSVHGPIKSEAIGFKMRLYQSSACLDCSKTRTFLDYFGFSYDVVEVFPSWFSKRHLKFAPNRRMPTLIMTQGNRSLMLDESALLISILRTMTLDPSLDLDATLAMYPSLPNFDADGNELQRESANKYFVMFMDTLATDSAINVKREEREWRRWADNELYIVVFANVGRSLSESFATLRYFSEVGNWAQTLSVLDRFLVLYVGALYHYFHAKHLKQKNMLKVEVRESLYDETRSWLKAIGPDRKFMGGEQPNLADLGVFGILHSIEGTDAFKDLLARTKIGPWYNEMKRAVENREGAKAFVQNLNQLKHQEFPKR